MRPSAACRPCRHARAPHRRRSRRASRLARRSAPVALQARRDGSRTAGRTRSPAMRARCNAGMSTATRSAFRPSVRVPSAPAPAFRPSALGHRPSGHPSSGRVPSDLAPWVAASRASVRGLVPASEAAVRPCRPCRAFRPSGRVPSGPVPIRHRRSIRRRRRLLRRPCTASARSRAAEPDPARCRSYGRSACWARSPSRTSGTRRATRPRRRESDRGSPSAPPARCRIASKSSNPADCRDHIWSNASRLSDRRPAPPCIEARPGHLLCLFVLRPPPPPR